MFKRKGKCDHPPHLIEKVYGDEILIAGNRFKCTKCGRYIKKKK